MTKWYDKYVNIPFKHLGNDPTTGMDCFNLCRYVYQRETAVEIPFYSYDHCNIVDDDWFNKTTDQLFEKELRSNPNCLKVSEPKVLDFVFLSIGSTNVTNHCALYVDRNKLLQIMIGRASWISPYGNYYKQYTTGIYRWTT
jgi:cell wall-associated NlpC family hydrolase